MAIEHLTKETMSVQTDFERFALDHKAHVHCQGCGGCIVDPAFYIQSYPHTVWCMACRIRIKAVCALTGAPLPWHKELEL